MRLIISVEKRFQGSPDGGIWTQTTYPYRFWERYLTVFDSIVVLARIEYVDNVSSAWKRSDGPHVSFHPIPYYVGPIQYLFNYLKIRKTVHTILNEMDDSAIIMRVPSQLASVIYGKLQIQNRPYGVEVIGDPYDVFAPGVVEHPLRRFFRWRLTVNLQRICQNASAVSYVTETTLQQRYPVASTAYSTHYSSVELKREAFVDTPRKYKNLNPIKVISIGSMDQLYKAFDILIMAVASLVHSGINITLTLVGDGRFKNQLMELAEENDVADRIHFTGQLAGGKQVWEKLDEADLFVLVSRTEGLPRAMIEAMARALPCIGSHVGGIPELLPAEYLVPPDDVQALSTKIQAVTTSHEMLEKMSKDNLDKAQNYRYESIKKRMSLFYTHILEKTTIQEKSH